MRETVRILVGDLRVFIFQFMFIKFFIGMFGLVVEVLKHMSYWSIDSHSKRAN